MPPRAYSDAILAIDGGKTKTALALYDSAGPVSRVTAGGLAILSSPGGHDAVRAALADGFSRVGAPPDLAAVCIGLNGVRAPSGDAREVVTLIRSLANVTQVTVTNDAITSYCGALGHTAGVVVAAGTGAAATAVGDDGVVRIVDGAGYLLGDDGSGFWIGRRGLRSALRYAEGRGGSRVLSERALSHYGSIDEMIATVHAAAAPTREVARFATVVADAARDGDAMAMMIWRQAGVELAHTALAALRSVPIRRPRVACTGGLFGAGSILSDSFHDTLFLHRPDAELVPAGGSAVDGARALADPGPADFFRSVIYRDPAA